MSRSRGDDPARGGSTGVEARAESSETIEGLEGGSDRGIFYRPHRFTPGELGPVTPLVEVKIVDGEPLRCAMHDVSQSGVAVEWPKALAVAAGDVLADVHVSFDAYEAYRGEAVVGSVRDVGDLRIVGAEFVDSLMNIQDVLQLRDVASWQGVDVTAPAAGESSWNVKGHAPFKALVGDFRLYLEEARRFMTSLEGELPWHLVHAGVEGPSRAALIERVRAEFVPEFLRYTEEIDAAIRGADSEDWRRLKEFSRLHLQDLLMEAPFAIRAYTKPLGYPGDYELMRFIYERVFEGQTLFAKAVHLAITQTLAAESVRTRKDYVKARILERALDPGRPAEPLRVAEVAAGSAQAVTEALSELEGADVDLDIVFFDQDELALELVYRRIKPYMDASAPRVNVTILHHSIKRFLEDPSFFQRCGPFDLIFCAGLFDYLRLPTAVRLCQSLYQILDRGGAAHVANAVPDHPTRWLMEHHLDWHLVYRTRAEMKELARRAAPDARLEVRDEATGVTPFVVLERSPGAGEK